jgi:BirA family biotin operon repressor/biotin-[acetyl-CoA-carboxylase] ligase
VIPLIHLGTVDSTQAFLKRHPDLGFCGVVAAEQTSGRGRGGNAWESRRGAGLWLSARLPAPSGAPGVVLQRAVSAAIEALAPCGVALGLKWPNDLVAWLNGRLVKLGGIIGEQSENSVTLGLGVNLRSAPEMPERAIPPASLASLGAAGIPDAADLAASVLAAWQNLDKERAPAFRWPGPGDAVRWEDDGGVCQRWEPDGRLAVQTERGLVLLASGDVSGAVAGSGVSARPLAP